MIANVAYDIHLKPILETRTIQESYSVPDVINDSSIVGSNPWVPNNQLRCNGVLTSTNVVLYPSGGMADSTSITNGFDLYTFNGLKTYNNGSFFTIMRANEEYSFDFLNPATMGFERWTLYCADYTSGSTNGMELKWKDSSGNNPPSITSIQNYICRCDNRRRESLDRDGINVLLGFDGFAYNPFSLTDSDKIVARLCIQPQYCMGSSANTGTVTVMPKLTGARYRSALSQNRRSMPYQYRFRSGSYDLTDDTVAKAIAFGMTNWVKIHDNFKQYIYTGMTETVPDFEYTKYLEFSDL